MENQNTQWYTSERNAEINFFFRETDISDEAAIMKFNNAINIMNIESIVNKPEVTFTNIEGIKVIYAVIKMKEQ